MIEEFKVKINSEIYKVILRKKDSNKHVYLRVKDKDLLEISSNRYFSKLDAVELINRQKEYFIKKQKYENSYLYFGERFEKNELKIDLDILYKNEAKKIIPILVEKFSKQMNLFPTSIKYRKNKRTWGSCNYKNGLNFNILLVQFPLEVIEYIVIHELAHIKHKNHSKAFWSLVSKYCSDYIRREKVLKSFL